MILNKRMADKLKLKKLFARKIAKNCMSAVTKNGYTSYFGTS